MFFFFYNLVLTLLAPIAVPYWLLRSRAKGQAWRDLPERLGYLGGLTNRTPADSIWLHAVSVGEVLSAVPLLRRLRERFPASPLYVSASTAAGRKLAGEKLAGAADAVFGAPLEFPWCVARVFRALRPRLLIVFETEIWPNYFLQAERFGAETLLLNGRMSDRSAPRYARLRPLFAPVLRRAGAILTQSEADRQRFLAAGAPPEKTQVGGNVKYDFDPPETGVAGDLKQFFQTASPTPIVIAGSTREGEEELLSAAFRETADSYRRALFVVAPRHPARCDEAAAAFDGLLPVIRRSKLDAAAAPKLPAVLLLDTLGELAGLYPFADVVFMGGSLNGWGGHNVLEPALAKRPVIVGPAMQNFRQIADDLLAVGGLLQVDSVEELTAVLRRLLGDPAARRTLGENAFRLARSKRGAAARGAAEAERLFQRALPRCPPRLGRRLALGIPAMLWSLAARLRLYSYSSGVRKPRRLSAPVLSIGNLTAGGVGKTPAVAWLVERLAEANIQAVVLTRGYGRDNPSSARIVGPGGQIDPRCIGDEPALLATRFQRTAPNAVIGVGADRFAVGARLQAEANPVAFVLDDGFQHLRLARDLDILLIDASRPLLGDCLLPLGRLREPLSSLKRTDVILLTRAEPERDYGALTDAIRRWNVSAPVFHSRTTATHLVRPGERRPIPLDSLRGKRILAFCGLGNPDAFRRQLTALGYDLAAWRVFPDHYRYTPADRKRLAADAESARADALVTTVKDLMNLTAPHDFARPLYALEIEFQVDEPAELAALVKQALKRRQNAGG